jgi:hypothetical protein
MPGFFAGTLDLLPTAAEIFSEGGGDEMDKFPPPQPR